MGPILVGFGAVVAIGTLLLGIAKWAVGEIRKTYEDKGAILRERAELAEKRADDRVADLEQRFYEQGVLIEKLLREAGRPSPPLPGARTFKPSSTGGDDDRRIRVEEFEEGTVETSATDEKERS